MKQKQLLLALACFYSLSLSAQTLFQKSFSAAGTELGSWVCPTADGAYMILGNQFGLPGSYDNIFLVKTDASGDSLWMKSLGGLNLHASSLQQTADGGFIIIGNTNNGVGGDDVLLVKTDGNGDVSWSKTFGGSLGDFGNHVLQTPDEGFLLFGNTYSYGAGDIDAFVLRTNPSGDTLWTQTFGTPGMDGCNTALLTAAGGCITTGFTNSTGANGYDISLTELDSNGIILWSKMYGGPDDEFANSLAQTPDSGYILCGFTESFGVGLSDIFLVKTAANGDTLWTRTYGGSGAENGVSALPTQDGGYIVLGYTNSFGFGDNDVLLLKLDVTGNVIWEKVYGGLHDDKGYSLIVLPSGGYFISGTTRSFGTSYYDIYLVQTDSLGNSGCNETSGQTVMQSPSVHEWVPGFSEFIPTWTSTNPAIAIAGTGSFNTFCSTTSLAETERSHSFQIFPNPVSDQAMLAFDGEIRGGIIEITNSMGVLVASFAVGVAQEAMLPVENFLPGIYLVTVSTYSGRRVQKLVKL